MLKMFWYMKGALCHPSSVENSWSWDMDFWGRPPVLPSYCTVSDSATPYSKCATPYTIGNKSHVIKNMAATVKFNNWFSEFVDHHCTVSRWTTPYSLYHVTRYLFYILYCTVSRHWTACIGVDRLNLKQVASGYRVIGIFNTAPEGVFLNVNTILFGWREKNLTFHSFFIYSSVMHKQEFR